jgi:hypothetical protein
MREGSSIAATKARAVNCATPGIVIRRRQAAEALVIRLMSASTVATAVITAVRAAIRPRMAAERPAPPFAGFESLFDEGGGERAREPNPEHDRKASNLVFQGHSLADQFLARDDQRAQCMSRRRLHMHGLEEASANQTRLPSRHCDRSCG